jgi:hypothetical protein
MVMLCIVASTVASSCGNHSDGAGTAEATVGQIVAAPETPDEVISVAVAFVETDYARAIDNTADYSQRGAIFDDWRITQLEHSYTYDDLKSDVYLLNWQIHTTTPDKVILSGSMSVDDDGWLTDTYRDSNYLVFDNSSTPIEFVLHLMINDAKPGGEAFKRDLQNALVE